MISQEKFLIILGKDFCELSRSDGGMFAEDALPLKKGIDEAVANEPEGSNPGSNPYMSRG